MNSAAIDVRLSEAVLADGALDAPRLETIRTSARQADIPLVEALRALHVIPEEALLQAWQQATGVEAFNPALVTQTPAFRATMARLLPEEIVRALRITPLRFVGASLQVAMAEPWNVATRTIVEAFTGCPVVPAAMLPSFAEPRIGDVDSIVARAWRQRRNVPLEALIRGCAERAVQLHAADTDVVGCARIVEVVLALQSLLCLAAEERASDVHLDPVAEGLRIRIRVDGRLREVVRAPGPAAGPLLARLRLLGKGTSAAGGSLLDAAFSAAVSPVRRLDVRLAVVPTRFGDRCSLRLVEHAAGVASLTELGLAPAKAAEVEAAISRTDGLVLVTGPTGSGKSSTLYAMLAAVTVRDLAVMTVEDPIERVVGGAVQVACNESAGLTFATVLRALLRQDPDVIMVGEVRDGDTARLAAMAAATGHLVLSSLHTNTAAGAFARLKGLGIDARALSSVVRAVVAQRLVRRLCPLCKRQTVMTAHVWQLAGGLGLAPVHVWEPGGCDQCAGTGYCGRVAIFEVLTMTPEVRAAVRNGADTDEIDNAARRGGMAILLEDGLARVRSGETSLSGLVGLA